MIIIHDGLRLIQASFFYSTKVYGAEAKKVLELMSTSFLSKFYLITVHLLL